jgi:hypothetical protein
MEEIASYAIPTSESIRYLTGFNSIQADNLMDMAGLVKSNGCTPKLNADIGTFIDMPKELSLDLPKKDEL